MQRTIIITGANGHLGQDVVRSLSEEGHKIIAVAGPGEINQSLKQHAMVAEHVDLFNEKSTETFVQSMIRQYPQLDAAVLLAGGFEIGNIENTDETLLDKQITLNFKTAWFVIKPLMAHFKKSGGGQFILMGAKPAVMPSQSANKVAYGLSKSLLFTLAEIVNADGKDFGITASIIVPEIIDTLQNRKDMPDADYSKWVKTFTLADIMRFILSDAGKWLHQPVFKVYSQTKK